MQSNFGFYIHSGFYSWLEFPSIPSDHVGLSYLLPPLVFHCHCPVLLSSGILSENLEWWASRHHNRWSVFCVIPSSPPHQFTGHSGLLLALTTRRAPKLALLDLRDICCFRYLDTWLRTWQQLSLSWRLSVEPVLELSVFSHIHGTQFWNSYWRSEVWRCMSGRCFCWDSLVRFHNAALSYLDGIYFLGCKNRLSVIYCHLVTCHYKCYIHKNLCIHGNKRQNEYESRNPELILKKISILKLVSRFPKLKLFSFFSSSLPLTL